MEVEKVIPELKKEPLPVLKPKWYRYFKIHTKSLLTAAKNQEDFKLYCLYINLHSLYRQKSIHKYKSKYQILAKKCGLKEHTFRVYLNKLKKINVCWEIGDNLFIGTPLKFVKYLNFEDDYYEGTKEKPFQFQWSKFTNLERKKHIDKYDLESHAIQIILEQKRFSHCTNEYNKGRRVSKITMSKKSFLEAKLKEQLAQTSPNIDLYLKEIAKLFGLNSIQAASYKLHKLSEKGKLETKKQLKFLKKVMLPNRRISDAKFIKDGWLIEQKANKIIFKDSFIEQPWWSILIDKHEDVIREIKVKKIKNKLKDSIEYLSTRYYNNLPLASYSRRKFKKSFINISTGEVFHEAIYWRVNNLLLNGFSESKKYITKFKKFKDIEKYTTLIEEIDKVDMGLNAAQI